MKNFLILLTFLIFGCKSLTKPPKNNTLESNIKLDSIYSFNKKLIEYFSKVEMEKNIEIEELKNMSKASRIQTIPPSSGSSSPQREVIIKWKNNTNIIKKTTKEIKLGNVVYKTPDTMVVLQASKVIVRISGGKLDTNSITDGIRGSVTMVPINITSKMEVKLIDPSPENDPNFIIKPITQTQQTIIDEVFTEWEFSVTPLKSGEKDLNLLVTIIEGDLIKQQTWSDKIKVKNNIPKITLTFWEKYWQWLMVTIIIPVFIYFWKKIKKKIDICIIL